jgi:hypothetical protein
VIGVKGGLIIGTANIAKIELLTDLLNKAIAKRKPLGLLSQGLHIALTAVIRCPILLVQIPPRANYVQTLQT